MASYWWWFRYVMLRQESVRLWKKTLQGAKRWLLPRSMPFGCKLLLSLFDQANTIFSHKEKKEKKTILIVYFFSSLSDTSVPHCLAAGFWWNKLAAKTKWGGEEVVWRMEVISQHVFVFFLCNDTLTPQSRCCDSHLLHTVSRCEFSSQISARGSFSTLAE